MGLRTLWQCLTVWHVTASLSMDGAQAILAHAAGLNTDSGPGRVNEYNAQLIRKLHQKLKIPVIIQGELADCLKDIQCLAVSPRQGELDHYLDTRDMVQWQKSVCHTHGINRIALVSYLPHFVRGKLATEKVGLEVLIPEGIIEIYDSKNSQRWARSGLVNRPYELLARLYYFFKNWI